MFEAETLKLWKRCLTASAIYLIFGLILIRSFILSGGFLAGPLPGLLFTYRHPAFVFINLLLICAMSGAGALSNISSNEERFAKYEDNPDMKMRLLTVAQVAVQASLALSTLFFLGVLDILVG